MLRIILNLPYTIFGVILSIISLPKDIKINKRPFAIIFTVRKFWWGIGYIKNMRAFAFGNTVALGLKTKAGDLEHEIIHVKQHLRYPFIFPFLYYRELISKGYRNNIYEKEAYGDKEL